MTTDLLPAEISTEVDLDEFMTRPSPALVGATSEFPGRIMILGAGGKMGPSLAVRAVRAAKSSGRNIKIFAASRFSNRKLRSWLDKRGVVTIACDVLDQAQVDHLPDVDALFYLIGRKFGTKDNPALTWAMNSIPVVNVVQRYAGIPVVALSTGCVYPLVPALGRGSIESDPMTPFGEYSNACVARERLFEYMSARTGTPLLVIRLNYALDLRYGVLVDLARLIQDGKAIDLSMGWFNAIWQGDANDAILRLLPEAGVPLRQINLTGPEVLSVRDVSVTLGERLNMPVTFLGVEKSTALLSDASKAHAILGTPEVPIEAVIRWTSAWISNNQRVLGLPTRFQDRLGTH